MLDVESSRVFIEMATSFVSSGPGQFLLQQAHDRLVAGESVGVEIVPGGWDREIKTADVRWDASEPQRHPENVAWADCEYRWQDAGVRTRTWSS